MSGGKARQTNSASVGKKTTFSDETNHAAVSLLPKKTDYNRWFPTLAPLTLLEAARKYVAKLNENRMLYNVSDATKAQIKDYYLTQIKGQTLDILWVFPSVEIFTIVILWILSTAEIQPHDGFITQWVFIFLPLQPSRILSMDSHPALAETTGLLTSWVFSFLPRTIPTSTDQQGGGLLSDHPHGHNHYTHSPRTGVDSSRHTHGSESSPIVQGLVQDLNVYKTHGV